MTGAGLTARERDVLARYRDAGQEQVFRFLDRLGPEERGALFAQAEGIDLELVSRLAREVLDGGKERPELAPIDALSADHPAGEEARQRGRELFRAGRVAFYTVAGGQGTRLGFDGPKGSYPVGPATGKTLFRWHAEKVLAASRRYARAVPWVLLVSETNEGATRRVFEENRYFGLEGRVRFVRQRMLPAVDDEGRILLRAPGSIMLSPNGHGGSIDALGHEGTLEWLRFLGVGYVSYFQVDNALVNPADPLFLGFQDLMGAEMTAKVVTKAHPEERAGVVAVVNGRPGVVEYSEISREDACARDPDGSLRYDLANIAAHGFSLGFLDRVRGVGLPYHTAVKKVPTVDADGSPVVLPGRKFETFVFDAIPLADGFLAYRTKREEEFAPLKNREGDDSPATVRQALLDRTRHWYRAAGLSPPDRMEDLEMSPLRAYDEETFRDWLREHRGGPRP